MLKLITERKEIQMCHILFEAQLRSFVSERMTISVGYQGESAELRVNYSEKLGIWWVIRNSEEMSWNPFGIGKPLKKQSNSIVCEINYLKFGRLTSRSGAFAKNESGELVLLHNGRIGGGRKGIGQSLFLDNFIGEILDVQLPNSIKRYAPVGDLESDRFPYQVELFVKEIGRIKQLVKETTSLSAPKPVKNIFKKEFAGTKRYNQSKVISAQCDHGLVVNTFRQLLRDRGYWVANDTNRDLYTLNKRNAPQIVFEFKTDVSTQSLYAAVGQLLLNNLHFNKRPKLVLVVPEKLSGAICSVLDQIGISQLVYGWKNDKPIFRSVDSVLGG
jgi:hypothetical protein